MSMEIKKSEVIKIYPLRKPQSHKGQNGRVLVIGGSIDYFGAPILAALGAMESGADLVYMLVPECNFEVTRSFYPDLIVRKYPGNYINNRTLDHINDLLEKVDCVLIGPGVTEDPESLRIITKIIQKTPCHVVLDAEAIPALAQIGLPTNLTEKPRITITPNRAEMDEITQGSLPDDIEEIIVLAEDFAKKWHVNLVLKGWQSAIASPNKPTRLNINGNAGMTVGGSGDVLAGFIASLISQHADSYEACVCASFLLGATADALHSQKGLNYTASDLAMELPYTIHNVIS